MRRRGAARAGSAGQAGVEHVALVAFVVLVLGGAAVVAGGLGAGLVNAVNSGIRRAICVAGGDRCAAFHDERPCVVRRDERGGGKALSIVVLRVGARVGVVREQWSDGRTTVTVHDDIDAGAEVGVGARIPFVGERTIGLSATAGAALRGGWGRSWTFERPAGADRLLEQLLDGDDGPDALSGLARGIDGLIERSELPVPDAEGIRLGSERSIRGELRAPKVEIDGELLGELEGEALWDRRSGTATVALGLSPAVLGRLTGPLGLELGGRLAGDARVAVTVDRDGRPRELRIAGALRTAEGTRREQAELRVDLTRPQVADALRELMRAARAASPARAVRAASTLGRWAVAEGALERQSYRVQAQRKDGGGSVALGIKLGYETTTTSSAWRLERAATRPPGGIWEQRIDCVSSSPS